ncbi:unnamed protein product [Angiostrongylus costaricensis]|uniref:BAR domain-containing protein n=1 Tax=Angiostrongylus costaricensis TaxID=334426 RepID=A0A158PML1_ANGCS|nr:unnamed protein product [Angiostrongylus costaricensis]
MVEICPERLENFACWWFRFLCENVGSYFKILGASGGIFYSTEAKSDQTTGKDDFDEKLEEGYDKLKNVPNENDTVNFLRELHKMEKEISENLTPPPERDADVMKAIEDYGERWRNHMNPMGDTIEEVNHNSKVDTALFQGDMILTKEQADEMLEDIKESAGISRKKTCTP